MSNIDQEVQLKKVPNNFGVLSKISDISLDIQITEVRT